jgi:hypothetical protein
MISVENTGLYVAHNCPDHQEIRITGVRITEGSLTSLYKQTHIIILHVNKRVSSKWS